MIPRVFAEKITSLLFGSFETFVTDLEPPQALTVWIDSNSYRGTARRFYYINKRKRLARGYWIPMYKCYFPNGIDLGEVMKECEINGNTLDEASRNLSSYATWVKSQ